MNDFTREIKKILDTPQNEMDFEAAALVLLKVNRNRILHQNILRRKDAGKLRYELQKMYNFRIKEDAVSETKKLEEEVAVIVKTTLPEEKKKNEDETKGKRQDHDALPDDIKAMFLENLNIFPRMRKLHEQLKLLAGAKACDRYPFLQQLVDLDKKLRSNWDTYDGYDASSTAPSTLPASGSEDMPSTPPASEDVDTTPLNETQDEPSNSLPGVKEINAARKYLSENKAKLSELKAAGETAKYEVLLLKVQQRLDLLISSNAGIKEEQLAELVILGCHA